MRISLATPASGSVEQLMTYGTHFTSLGCEGMVPYAQNQEAWLFNKISITLGKSIQILAQNSVESEGFI